ncbi:DEAD/DEAH box helicase family protein [Candidatus Pelagibacter sp.]|uniref:DEAD/DEAH box helicase family protein n=1 Tax=Candidatus Pelagibacter sp. TaxID=2024849 RepID=UPI003F875C53
MQERKIIQQSKSFKDLDRTLKKLIKNKKAKLAGSIFEYLTKLFLEVSPEYKTKLRKVYLLNEIPTAVKRKLKLPNTDEGIDLIAETFDNEYWAIQCKYRSDKTETLKVKGDLATFNNLAFTVCKNISHGLISATVNRPPQKKQLLSVGYILLNEWLKLDRDNGELFSQIKAKAIGKIVKPKKLSPRPHQKEAILKTISYFKSNERGKMIMPCGTGKSLTAFWIAEKMKPKSILIAVPSLALLQQTLKVWTREFLLNNIEPDWLCVCSDDTVKEEQDDFVTFSADLGIKVDTDPRVIRNFLRKKTKKLKIVFTTYQSGRATAIGSKGFKYDLGIMDEAHKTVGSGKKPMAHLLHQKNIKINKRLFMTATERLFRGDSDEFMSMDDPRDYGNLIYELSFKKAINSKPPIISDYKIITFGITIPEIEKIAEDNKYLEVKKDLKDITARELATAIALRKAIKKLKIKNAISFHRSIKRAENFRKQQDLISRIYPTYGKLKTFHVRGDMPTSDRALEMLSFEEEKGLMTNARCLTEGVDLPAIDCVCFTDPKRSKVDIVQAAGRALRLAKGKKFGYILIPIFIPDGMDFNAASEAQGFDDVSVTVRALATTDKRIVEYLAAISEGKKPKGGSPVEGITSINQLYKVEAEEFKNAVQLKIWDKVAFGNWKTFEDARTIIEKYNFSNSYDYVKRKKNYKELLNIPAAADVIYKDEWKGWGYFLRSRSRSQAVSIEEASKFAVKNNIKSGTEWRKFKKEKKLPFNIPKSPDAFYEKRGTWISWGSFLKTGSKSKNYYDFRYSLKQIKEICIKNKINNTKDYQIFVKKNPSLGLPLRINKYYKEYKAAHIFFASIRFPSLKELKSIARKNKITSMLQWRNFYNKNKDKINLVREPGNLDFYKNDWKGSYDFLGINEPQFKLRDCMKIIHKFKFLDEFDYKKYVKKKIIKNVPKNPKQYFTKNAYWPGWKIYLGYKSVEYYSYEEAKRIVKSKNIKSAKDFSNKKFMFDKRMPKAIDQVYKNKKKWKGWNDFLGKN